MERTKIFQSETSSVTAAGNTSVLTPSADLVWTVPEPMLIERVSLSARQINGAFTIQQRVACEVIIVAPGANWPPPGILPSPPAVNWSYSSDVLHLEFAPNETIKDLRGAELFLQPTVDVAFLSLNAYGQFILNDFVRFRLHIWYREVSYGVLH